MPGSVNSLWPPARTCKGVKGQGPVGPTCSYQPAAESPSCRLPRLAVPSGALWRRRRRLATLGRRRGPGTGRSLAECSPWWSGILCACSGQSNCGGEETHTHTHSKSYYQCEKNIGVQGGQLTPGKQKQNFTVYIYLYIFKLCMYIHVYMYTWMHLNIFMYITHITIHIPYKLPSIYLSIYLLFFIIIFSQLSDASLMTCFAKSTMLYFPASCSLCLSLSLSAPSTPPPPPPPHLGPSVWSLPW